MGRRPASWSDQMGPSMTLEQALKTYDRALIAAGRSDATRKTYTLYISRFISYLKEDGQAAPKVSQLAPERIHGFVAWLKQQPPAVIHGRVMTKGPQSIHSHVVILKTFAHFLLDHGVFKADPLSVVRNPKRPITEVLPFTHDEIRLMVAVIGDGPYATRNRALIYFMLATGCRVGEVCAVKVKDLDLKAHLATVWGKGRKQRTVQFDRVTARYLALWLSERPEGQQTAGCVFVSNVGTPLSTAALYRIVKGIGDKAGVDDAHPHRWRHSMATLFLEAYPGQVFQLQTLLGHAGLDMTRRYARAAQARDVLTGPSIIDTAGLR